ncbi:MAG: ATP-binding protein [Coxiellaceae bacterium]|nr:ATP-binding protein [Coxiellaceae bacterium]
MNRSKRNFGILFIGMLVIFVFAGYLVINMIQVDKRKLTPQHKIRTLQHIQNALTQHGRARAAMQLRRPGLHIQPSSTPASNSKQITATIDPTLKQWLKKHPNKNSFSIAFTRPQLNDQQRWLVVRFRPDQLQHAYLQLDFWILIILAVIYIVFCYWVVYDFSKPIKHLKQLTDKLSQGNYPLQVLTVGNDEIAPISEAINHMSARITQLLNDRTQMLAAISHDLRTPITRLRLRAENLQGEQQVKVLKDLDEMEIMIKGVLEFVQSESDEPASHFDMVAMLDTLCIERQDAGQDCTLNTDLKHLTYTGQMQALRRTIANIIDNAIKYGEVAKVSLNQSDKSIVIKITDQGPGIPENEQLRVFQPFYRVESSRNKATGGTGLGLVIAKNIIQQHQGTITLSNLSTSGLCVTIELTTPPSRT